MASSSRIYPISLGTLTVASSTLTIIGSGSSGTVGAKRILTHPDEANFPALAYYRNPDSSLNIDNDALHAPVNSVVLTEGTTQIIRSPRSLEDVLVTERWEGGRGRASMPTSFFRLLYEYFVNPPDPDPDAQEYITWEPRDVNSHTYNVEIVSLVAGRGGAGTEFEATEVTESGGSEIPRAIDGVDPGVTTGLLPVPVTLVMRLVSKVTS